MPKDNFNYSWLKFDKKHSREFLLFVRWERQEFNDKIKNNILNINKQVWKQK